ncbi:IS1380 family transposase, partial [bacterium]|nr:IS1380 family transposase [bacterium]
TILPGEPDALYSFLRKRGHSENWIKNLKNAAFADRLSCHLFSANRFRLFLRAAACILLFRLRERLASTVLATCQMDTLRLILLKIGARVQISARRIWFHLVSGHLCADIWHWLEKSLTPAPPLA